MKLSDSHMKAAKCYLQTLAPGPVGARVFVRDGRVRAEALLWLLEMGWVGRTEPDLIYYITDAGRAALAEREAKEGSGASTTND